MSRLEEATWITLLGCAALVAWLFSLWITAPVLGTMSIQSWWWVGVATAAVVGGLAVLLTRQWRRVAVAVGIGLMTGAAWAEVSQANDVPLTAVSASIAVGSIWGREIGAFFGSACAGGLLVHAWLFRRTQHWRRFGSDG